MSDGSIHSYYAIPSDPSLQSPSFAGNSTSFPQFDNAKEDEDNDIIGGENGAFTITKWQRQRFGCSSKEDVVLGDDKIIQKEEKEEFRAPHSVSKDGGEAGVDEALAEEFISLLEYLKQAANQPGYGIVFLRLLSEQAVEEQVRQSALVNFKNYVRYRWALQDADSSDYAVIQEADKEQIKVVIVASMLNARCRAS